MFNSIIPSTGITTLSALYCCAASILLGIVIAVVYMIKNTYTKSFVTGLCLLPLIVQVVIMMVNGNIGTGVAIVGAFSLIRFRSVAGSTKEIVTVFWAMAVGLATGMGYIAFAAAFTLVASVVYLAIKCTSFGEKKTSNEKRLKITIPEDLDYTGVFDDLFAKYLKKTRLETVKTTNLGSMFELKYYVVFKNIKEEKSFIDEIRTRNGNLPIVCSQYQTSDEL